MLARRAGGRSKSGEFTSCDVTAVEADAWYALWPLTSPYKETEPVH